MRLLLAQTPLTSCLDTFHMNSEDMDRRMIRLKYRRTVEGKPDDYLKMLLDDALAMFLELTHRTDDPGQRIDGLLCELASLMSNQEGAEYTSTAKEGEFERQYQGSTLAIGIPDVLYKRIISYRLVVGLNAEHAD